MIVPWERIRGIHFFVFKGISLEKVEDKVVHLENPNIFLFSLLFAAPE